MLVPVFCCFWFQKSYTGNILGNRRDKNQKSYNCRGNTEDREGVEDTQQGGHTLGRRGLALGRADLVCGALVWPPALPFRLLKASVAKPPVPRATIRKTFQRRRRRQSHLGGFRRSPPAPCRRGESSPGGLFIAMIASGLMCE